MYIAIDKLIDSNNYNRWCLKMLTNGSIGPVGMLEKEVQREIPIPVATQ